MTEPLSIGQVFADWQELDRWPPPGTPTDPDDPYYYGHYAP